MVIRDPSPLFPSLTRLGALVAVAAVTLWWMRRRRREGSRLVRRPAAEATAARGELMRVQTRRGTKAPGRHGKRGPENAAAQA